ncbi:MAG: lysophospholipid acyltransferase family protein [Planctomycetes bacterium]|nr:lysophospholipid acyltransferase family protein [Planctomycetota bacterium]
MTSPAQSVEPIRDKPHGPPRTLGRRLLGPLHVTGIAWYRLHYWATFFPEWFIVLVIHLSTWFFWATLWQIRSAVAHNLEAVLGPCGWFTRQRRIWRTFHEYAWCLTERYEQFHRADRMRFDFAGEATYARMQATERGFVFFTAHFGNWEMGPLVRDVPRGRKIHVVREPEMGRAAQRFVAELFERHPLRDQFVVHYAGADLALGARLLMALRQGDVVAMPGDRPRAGMDVQRSTMFGRPMDLPPGPAALARAANAPLVPVFVFREGRRHYRVELREPIEVERTDDKARDVARAVDRMAAECERAIRERPHHWFCWARLW